jgi:hypothetical protein
MAELDLDGSVCVLVLKSVWPLRDLLDALTRVGLSVLVPNETETRHRLTLNLA